MLKGKEPSELDVKKIVDDVTNVCIYAVGLKFDWIVKYILPLWGSESKVS